MAKIETWDGPCPHCNTEESEDGPVQRLSCPTCGRDGCDACMPAGVGVECPECEESKG